MNYVPEVNYNSVEKRAGGGKKGRFMKKKLLMETLYREHAKWIYKKLVKMGCTPEEAEDAMQNAYVIAFEKFEQLKNQEAYVSWFLKIAIHTAYKDLKKNRRVKTVSMPVQSEMEAGSELLPDDWERLSVYDDPETRLILKEAFLSLPEQYRIPLCLHLEHNYRYSEIAEILGIREGTVKSRISRAKAILREMLCEE